VLKRTRQVALSLLATPRPAGETLALLLLYGYQAQEELNCGEALPFDPDAALQTIQDHAKPGNPAAIAELYTGLEILTCQWQARLQQLSIPVFPENTGNLIRYFVNRYWLQAVSDYDLACRVKFIVLSCLVICSLGGDFIESAQLYSKEIENSCENVEALLDAVYSSPALTDDKLLGLLTGLSNS